MGEKQQTVAENTDNVWKDSRERMVIPVSIIDTMDGGKSRAVMLPPGTVRVLTRKNGQVVLQVARKYIQEKTFL